MESEMGLNSLTLIVPFMLYARLAICSNANSSFFCNTKLACLLVTKKKKL